MKTPIFADKKDFFDFFSDCDFYSKTIKNPNPRKFIIFPDNISDYCAINGICEKHSIVGYMGIRVKPRQEIINWITNNMLMIPTDKIYFEIIVFPGEDYARIYASYSIIIGSRLLGLIKTKSIPEQFKREKKS